MYLQLSPNRAALCTYNSLLTEQHYVPTNRSPRRTVMYLQLSPDTAALCTYNTLPTDQRYVPKTLSPQSSVIYSPVVSQYNGTSVMNCESNSYLSTEYCRLWCDFNNNNNNINNKKLMIIKRTFSAPSLLLRVGGHSALQH